MDYLLENMLLIILLIMALAEILLFAWLMSLIPEQPDDTDLEEAAYLLDDYLPPEARQRAEH